MNATTWMNLKNIMLSERNESQKTVLCYFIYIKYPKGQIQRDRKQVSVCPQLEGLERNGTYFGDDENVLKSIVMIAIQVCEYINNH